MTDVALRNQQTGLVSSFPEEQAAQLLANGGATGQTFEPVTAPELTEIQRTNYSESGLGQLEAAGRGAVDWLGELPIGLAGRAMGAEGPLPSLSAILEGAAAEVAGATPLEAGQLIASEADVGRRLEQEAGFAYGAGEVLGQIATLGTGGTMGVLGRIGEGAAARAGLGRVGQLVAQSGLEGAAQAAGAALMADPQRSAQSVIADAGLGALIGGMAGGALPAAGAFAGRGAMAAVGGARKAATAAGEAFDSLLGRSAAEVADGASRKGVTAGMHDAYANAVAAVKNLDPEMASDYVMGGRFSEIGEYSARNLGEIVDAESRKASGQLRGISRDVDSVLEEFRASPAKAEHIRANTDQAVLLDPRRIEMGTSVAKNTLGVIQSIRDEALALKASGYKFTKAGLDALENTVRQAEQMADAGSRIDDLADAFALGDRVKRSGDAATKALREGASFNRAGMNDFERDLTRKFADQIQEANDSLRASLEEPKIYGDYAASTQQKINAAYSLKDENGISGVDALNAFRDVIMRRTDRTDFATGRTIYELDPAKLKAVFAGLGTQERELAERDLKNYITRASDAMRAHAEAGAHLGEAYTGKALRAAEGLDGIRQQLDNLEATHLHASNWKKLEGGGSDALGGSLIAAGAIAGGPLGAILGGAAAAVANPARVASAVNGLAAAARRSGVSADGLRKWVATGAKRARAVGETVARGVTEDGRRAARATGRAARPVITSAAVRAFIGPRAMSEEERPDPRKQYREQLRRLERYRPGMVAERLSSDGSVPPQVAAALDAKASEATRYCLERAPSAKYGGAVRPGMPYQPSSMEIDAFARMWGAAHHPQTALDDIQAGTATSQQVATVRDLYPDVYRAWQASALAGLAEADSDGIPVGIGQRAYLASVLDLDGAGDPFLTDSFGASMRSFQAMTAPQPTGAQPPPPSPLGMQAQTPAQSMLSMA